MGIFNRKPRKPNDPSTVVPPATPQQPDLPETLVRGLLPDVAALPTIPRPATTPSPQPTPAIPAVPQATSPTAAISDAQPTPPTAEAINAALQSFIGTRTYDDTRTVLTAQQATLFHRDTLLALLLHARNLNDADDADQRQLELLHLGILLVGREQGIAAAWEWLLPILRDEKAQREREAQEAMAALLRQMQRLPAEQQAHLNALMQRANQPNQPDDERQQHFATFMAALLAAVETLGPDSDVVDDGTRTEGDLSSSDVTPIAASPQPTTPPPDYEAVEALLARPGMVDDDTAQALRAWLGMGDARATPDAIAAALERIRPLLPPR